ncbi:MAG: hypothetical protein WC781_02395 [Candidatus Pacearchaeota archaeon]|jgi:hypothetical protein
MNELTLEKLGREICLGHIVNQANDCAKCPWDSTKDSCLIRRYIPANTSHLIYSGLLVLPEDKNGKYHEI